MKSFNQSKEEDYLALAKEMVEGEGIDPMAPTEWGFTIFHAACAGGHYQTVKYLYENHEVDIQAVQNEKERNTALHCACKGEGDLQTVMYLVEAAKADVHSVNFENWTPLYFACYKGHLDVVEYLVEERKANINAVADRNVRPLTCAAAFFESHRSDKVVQYLAPKCAVDDKILRAVWHKDLSGDSKRLMLEAYARTKLRHVLKKSYLDAYPMHAVIQSRLPLATMYRDCVDVCFPKSSLATMDDQGRLPLHLAVQQAVHDSARGLSATVVTRIFESEPRAATVKDATTGLYPFEVIAENCSYCYDGTLWFNVFHSMLRQHDPKLLWKQRVPVVPIFSEDLEQADDEYIESTIEWPSDLPTEISFPAPAVEGKRRNASPEDQTNDRLIIRAKKCDDWSSSLPTQISSPARGVGAKRRQIRAWRGFFSSRTISRERKM